MKILFILEYYPPHIGGVEKLFGELTRLLASSGHQITVITNRYSKKLPKVEVSSNLVVKRIPLKNRFIFSFFGLFFMLKEARNSNLIHTTSYNAALPAWILGKIFKKRTLITFHEVWDQLWFQLPFLNKFQRLAYYNYEKFILRLPFNNYVAVSDFTKKKLIDSGIEKGKIIKIYNGIVKEDYQSGNASLKYQNENYVFTYFGRLGVSKGLDLIIPAFSKMMEDADNIRLKLIVPHEPLFIWNQLQKMIKAYPNIENKLIMLHELSFEDLKSEIIVSDCILIPSYSEGFCFAAVETAELDTALISSGRGALRETVSGKVIEMNTQDTNGLYMAMKSALKNEFDQIPKKRFELNDSLNQYQKMYEKIISD